MGILLILVSILIAIGLGFYLMTQALKRYQRRLFEAIEPSLAEHFDEIKKVDGNAKFYSEEEVAAMYAADLESQTPSGAIKKKFK